MSKHIGFHHRGVNSSDQTDRFLSQKSKTSEQTDRFLSQKSKPGSKQIGFYQRTLKAVNIRIGL